MVLNQEYNITEIINDNSYKISARAAGTSLASITVNGALVLNLVSASGSDSGNGGSS